MERYEINKIITAFNESIKDLERAVNMEKTNKRIDELNQLMQASDFWSKPADAKRISQELRQLEIKKETISNITNQYNDVVLWFDEAVEQTETWDILESEISDLQSKIRTFEIETLLNEPYDMNDAILELHPGAGGTESMDWCDMLYRMYARYAENKGFKVEVLNYLPGEEAGIKSVSIRIKGDFAYGYLKAERGVHRLVRISPFDSNKRRHTSFVSCDVVPEFDDDIDIQIKEDELKIDVYRSSGAGGQSVNTTDSAVRITHLPTNTVVTCQNERSQLKNKEQAIRILKSKLFQLKLKEKEDEIRSLKGEQKEIGWGSQIRSYVFQPYQMVKDHRTNYEVGNIASVMDGNLDGFINSYLKERNNE